MGKITFEDKVSVVLNPLPRKNKLTADDMNEIKTSVNELYDSIEYDLDPNGEATGSFQIGSDDLELVSIDSIGTPCTLSVGGVGIGVGDTVPAWSIIDVAFLDTQLCEVVFKIVTP